MLFRSLRGAVADFRFGWFAILLGRLVGSGVRRSLRWRAALGLGCRSPYCADGFRARQVIVGEDLAHGNGLRFFLLAVRTRGVEGMGFGDVKLMGMIGAFLGLKLTVFTLFAASIAGSIFGLSTMLIVWMKRTRRRQVRHHEAPSMARHKAWQSARLALRYYQMPFGVFLGSMAMVALFFGESFLHWYWKLL